MGLTPSTLRKILVCHEKHGDRYFLIRDELELHAVSKKILAARLEEGWYSMGSKPSPFGMTLEDIKRLLKGEAKDILLESFKRYQQKLKEYEEEVKFIADVKTAMKSDYDPSREQPTGFWKPAGSGSKPWRLLDSRSSKHYEYECIELIEPENIQ